MIDLDKIEKQTRKALHLREAGRYHQRQILVLTAEVRRLQNETAELRRYVLNREETIQRLRGDLGRLKQFGMSSKEAGVSETPWPGFPTVVPVKKIEIP